MIASLFNMWEISQMRPMLPYKNDLPGKSDSDPNKGGGCPRII